MKDKSLKLSCFLGIVMLCVVSAVYAQDTIRISMSQAEKQFLEKNLQLLSEHYNIDIARAQVIQAKLFDNPSITLAGNLYDPQRKKVFNVSNANGQYDIAVQQLIRLAGKRNKEVRLAQTGATISENQFETLLSTLQFSLHSSFHTVYYLQRSSTAYSVQLASLEKLNAAYEQLQVKGIVSLKDALRIKSLYYSIKAEQASLQNRINEEEASLQLLLQSNNTYFQPEVTTAQNFSVEHLNLQALIDTATAHRPELKLTRNAIVYNEQNYSLQKALAKPDLTVGAEFDKRGSFVDNATFLSLAIDLPFFKRNQGNIRAAKFGLAQSKLQNDLQVKTVENDVQLAYYKLLNTDKLLRSMDPSFESQYEQLLKGITENFQKKNISLIEFTDFYESYKENILQLNQLKDDRMQAMEALQFAAGIKLFN